ncbi:hypothetical protein BGX33_010648 [Mortierella sp. NVP41]|nr:hypothetical protein BGX33_010648 [Mortierella sp. NVP41]
MDIPEIRALVAEQLDLDSLCAAALVSRSWRDTCMPLIWSSITWTSQLNERPASQGIAANAQLIRTLNLLTLKPEAAPVGGTSGGEGESTAAGGFPFAPCRRIDELNLQLNIRQKKTWEHLTDLVQNNSRITTVSVFLSGIPPTIEFMRALARNNSSSSSSSASPSSSPQGSVSAIGTGLKTFITMFLDLNKQTTEALLDLATQLETLQLNGATTVDPGSMDRWPDFSNLKTLKLGLNSGITPHHQLQIIQRCPRLQSLAWDLEESASTGPSTLDGPDTPLPNTAAGYYNYRFPTTAVCELFNPEFCPDLEKLSITYPALSDQELARIVHACPRLTLFEVFETGFGTLAFQAMTRHFANLTRLDIRRCAGVTSPMAQQILTSCPRLTFFCGDALHARDIVGLQVALDAQAQNPDVPPPAIPVLQPQDWVCTELTWLTLFICGLDMAPPEWINIVYHQLSRLTNLDFLTISPTGPEFDGTKDGLPLSLNCGLRSLSTLTNLERFCFHGLAQEMHEEDVQWMVDTWPRLIRVEGVVHPLRERRQALEPILRKEGIEVCGYFGDDDEDAMGLHIIVSEDEDEDVIGGHDGEGGAPPPGDTGDPDAPPPQGGQDWIIQEW